MRKRITSFRHAFNGLLQVFRTEVNMLIHLLIAILVIISGFIFNLNLVEWSLILICIAMVFAAETGNTVVEKYLDLYHPELNPKIGVLKDMSAAAVLILSFFSAVIGLLIFVPKILVLFWDK